METVIEWAYSSLTNMRTSKRLLEQQIEVFLEWGRRNSIATIDYKRWLDLFVAWTDKHDVLDITVAEIDLFLENEENVRRTQYTQLSARKALMAFLRFYMARSRNGKARLKGGRPPHISEIAEVQRLRSMRDTKGNPLSFRAIQKIMGKPIALVHRWSKYQLDKHRE